MAFGQVNTPGATGTEVADARTMAQSAEEAAKAAKIAAEGAQETADAALGAANNAGSAAQAAQRTADDAASAAATAKSTADTAKSTADTAKSTADTAKQTAEAAAQAAADAQTAADAAAQAITDLNSTITSVPTQSGTIPYDGASHMPSWNNYDPDKLTLSVTAQTNAGTYSATFTPQSGYKWSDGSTTGKTASWAIERATITLPAQSGTLTYTGSSQTPSWNTAYDSAKMTLSVTGQTNAGDYTADFTPKANYKWSDGSTSAKSAPWSIGKAAGSLSLSPTSLTLDASSLSKTITATRAGNGTVSASSSNTAIATVSVSGTTITVTGKAKGSATITVSVAAGTNHTAPANKTASVTVDLPTKTLNENSWATIKAVSDADQGANYWDTGDTKEVTINGTVAGFTFSNLKVNAFIIGFNHNSTVEGTHRIHFLFGKINGTDVAFCDSKYNNTGTDAGFRMNQSNSNAGGWNGSYMRKTVLGNTGTPSSPPSGSFMAALPSDLRAVMKSVTKYTDNTGNSSNVEANVTATTDYLFLLAEFEAFGARSGANQYEQNKQLQYDYFKANNTAADRIAYNHTAVTAAVWWWLRSARYNSSDTFRDVYADGSGSNGSAYYSGGLRPGFAA